jgi:hypothetical protein
MPQALRLWICNGLGYVTLDKRSSNVARFI